MEEEFVSVVRSSAVPVRVAELGVVVEGDG
jgi:hypothetical protein